MRFLSSFFLTLVALSGILVSSHPTTGVPSELAVRADGDVSLLPAREAVYLPVETELELRELKETFALVKRDTLDARNPVLIRLVAQAVVTIVRGIIQAVAEDKLARAEFTANFIQLAMGNYPQFNWVICHVDHVTLFDGVKDEDWGHGHEEFDITIGGTIGYEIYWFTSGTFVRLQDGGYLNWAYGGNIFSRIDTDNPQSATVVFGPTT